MSTDLEPDERYSPPVSLGRRLMCAACACLCITSTFLAGEASAQEADDLMEVFWEFKYSGGVNTVVSSLYDGERFYVSLGDLFGALQINLEQAPSRNMAHGFYLQTSRPYEFDFNVGRFVLGTSELRFDSTEFVRQDLGFFLAPALLERTFSQSITLDERNLTLSLSTPDEMPVVAAQRRRASRVIRRDQSALQRNAPLLFDRRRTLISGGVVGYRLSSTLTGTVPRASINLRGGGELLGGDLELGMNGRYADNMTAQSDFSFDVDSWKWRYVASDLFALRQIHIGQMNSDGLRSFSFTGVRASNDPVSLQRFFGSYPMRVESQPDWEVELYLNNQLIEVRTADEAGIVNFAIPITYGSTTVTIREYGPTGEFRESARRIQVPFTFVPSGDIRYNLFAGRSTTADRDILQATTSVGLTGWLTTTWGFDYVTPDSTRSGERLANLSWGAIAARVGPSYVLTLRGSPGAQMTASLNAFYPSMASFSVDFTQYGTNRIYNSSGRRHQSRATLSLPFRVAGLPVNWRTTLSEESRTAEQFDFTAQQNVTVSPGVFRLDLGFRGDARLVNGDLTPRVMRFEPRLGYSFARRGGVPKPLRGLLVSLRSSYDVQQQQLLNLSANFSRRIAGSIRLQADFVHQVQRRESSLNLRVSMDLNTFRATTGTRVRSTSAPTFTQDVSGALSYDRSTRSVTAADRDWVGRAAATVRMFVDYNGNDRLDDGEPIIENGRVSFRRAVSTRQGPDGTLVAYNLQAYEQYNLTVDQSRIRNPFWIPKFEEFSFVSDPNVHKLIEIPFLVSGEVTGSALRQTERGLVAVPGLKLQIRQVDGDRRYEEPVFSDGTFYKLGILPGTYRAWVDSTQMRILGTVSDPPVREFTVAATESGDAVDGIDFVLLSPGAATGGAVQESEAVETAGPNDVAEPEIVVSQPTQPERATEERTEAVAQSQDGAETSDDAAPAPDSVSSATVYIIDAGLAGLKQLAEMVYDDESLWPKIWLANTDLIEDPADVRSGMRFEIPPKASLTAVERAAGQGYEASLGETETPEESGGLEETPGAIEADRPQTAPETDAPGTSQRDDARPDDEQSDDVQTDGEDAEGAPSEGEEPEGEEREGEQPSDGSGGQSTEDAGGVTIHRVVPGDVSLMNLARIYYDAPFLWPKIWLANRDVLPRPEALDVGMELKIPEKAPLTPEEQAALEEYNSGR